MKLDLENEEINLVLKSITEYKYSNRVYIRKLLIDKSLTEEDRDLFIKGFEDEIKNLENLKSKILEEIDEYKSS